VNTREFNERLRRRARRAGVAVDAALAARLEVYFRLLSTWNERINLTALDLREPGDETFDRLLVEPLVAARHVSRGAKRMIDIGSGGGSPALPLALAVRELSVVMVESKTRKSVFLREAVRALELAHAEVATARFEELLARPDLHEAHDLVTIRAVRVESRLLLGIQAFLRPGGQLFLFRGSSSGDLSGAALPPLAWVGAYPLVESLRSRLVVLEKRTIQM
jgi:16S rRNA (guanine527-N7)-methyltransferase